MRLRMHRPPPQYQSLQISPVVCSIIRLNRNARLVLHGLVLSSTKHRYQISDLVLRHYQHLLGQSQAISNSTIDMTNISATRHMLKDNAQSGAVSDWSHISFLGHRRLLPSLNCGINAEGFALLYLLAAKHECYLQGCLTSKTTSVYFSVMMSSKLSALQPQRRGMHERSFLSVCFFDGCPQCEIDDRTNRYMLQVDDIESVGTQWPDNFKSRAAIILSTGVQW